MRKLNETISFFKSNNNTIWEIQQLYLLMETLNSLDYWSDQIYLDVVRFIQFKEIFSPLCAHAIFAAEEIYFAYNRVVDWFRWEITIVRFWARTAAKKISFSCLSLLSGENECGGPRRKPTARWLTYALSRFYFFNSYYFIRSTAICSAEINGRNIFPRAASDWYFWRCSNWFSRCTWRTMAGHSYSLGRCKSCVAVWSRQAASSYTVVRRGGGRTAQI